ncbi:MAG: sulfite exporter TauE/SafE family protein [Haloarculaceae archaeon]
MAFGYEVPLLAAIVGVVFVGVVFVGGLVKGTTGFGYAIASTAILAAILGPSVAVVLMIVPTLAANLSLLRELDRGDLRTCVARFWPYVIAAVIGTLADMALLDRVPKPVLTLGLGGFTLGYVIVAQDRIVLPGERRIASFSVRSATMAKVGLGLFAGVVFGASNVAVQVVAYLDSLDLDHGTFVGVLAMILVGISTTRVGAAWTMGPFGGTDLVWLSVLVAVPGLFSVSVGQRIRTRVPKPTLDTLALGLLAIIGLKLIQAGAAALL